MLAAARATDILVLAAAFTGAALVLAGVATINPRVRVRLPVAALARGSVRASVALIAAGIGLFTLALG